jgi:C-terminal processing protease CtpA/Prc
MATGSESTMSYQADVNLDHEFNEEDTISDLNLFCLISSQSFSCANLVPWAFKEDGRVTLLGKTSGGGSCVVRPLTTAWGTSFKISGSSQISFVKNGAYYDVDQGVEPDFTIMDYNHFYDREALTKYISELF